MAASAVESLKNKLVQKLQNTKLLRETREFESLVRAIGECKSKAEEDRIIIAEIEVLKQRFSDPRIDKSRGREYLVRLLYCELLGHDVSWAYVKTLQFASEPNLLTKKAAYLALTQFFDHNHELVLLLVNTMLSDLKSDNFINVCTALVVCTKLINVDLINAVLPSVVDKLRHPKEHVRKKAIMALHRFHQLDPLHEGPLSGMDLDKHFRTMLCDKDPGVMSAALCALHDIIKADSKPYMNLIPSFTSILKQVAEHRLPKSYDYHRFPAPFIQIKLLKILALLGAGDRPASENMYAVLQQTLRRANTSHTIGNAIIFECVNTITTIYPNPHLLVAAADAIATFLRSPSHNLRYVGVDALAGICKIHPNVAQEHQLAVVDCLEDPDDTLKLKTLELLYKMTKGNNVEVIVERMMGYLRTVSDDHIKRDIARKVAELAERYAPSPSWFIRVVSEVLQLGGEHVGPGVAHALSRLVAEQDEELHRSAVQQYLKLLDAPSGTSRHIPDALLQVVVWVLGEYGSLATSPGPGERGMPVPQLMTKLVALVTGQKSSDTVHQMLLPALAKLCVQSGCSLPPEADAWVGKASQSQNVELQQRAYELQALLTAPTQVQAGALPHDASCEAFETAELEDLKGLTFLDWYVDKALQAGAAPHVPASQRQGHGTSLNVHATIGSALRFDAYGPTAPSPSHHAHTSSASGAFALDPFLGSLTISATSQQSGWQGAGQTTNPAPVSANKARGPQLVGAAGSRGTGPGWGPAQFEAPFTSHTAGGRGEAGRSQAALVPEVDLLGGLLSPGPPTTSSNQHSQLFDGLGGWADGGAAQQPTAQLSARPYAPLPLPASSMPFDLMSLDDLGPGTTGGRAPREVAGELLMALGPVPTLPVMPVYSPNFGVGSPVGGVGAPGLSVKGGWMPPSASAATVPTRGLGLGGSGGAGVFAGLAQQQLGAMGKGPAAGPPAGSQANQGQGCQQASVSNSFDLLG
eukprot:CAMPEP_0119112054 /NCGR_PEP_ID=MMETSP1180-20130426/38536_1 /TAXON_ID=3052 ORGANISM="Chlamydomonas cf sp, Strain CCMP681" /NCGR_SAMPLE_ID=MMETSP1180 /ASSEMBLY_ACC=CAM_ASM_000741 /LENGTH=978 /DNA_ID=CAMNT_0007099373 /DNA_START=53 /DNA_END=2989 /DNA_ORIENTATION=+